MGFDLQFDNFEIELLSPLRTISEFFLAQLLADYDMTWMKISGHSVKEPAPLISIHLCQYPPDCLH